jgi:hypothetical protein
MSANSEKSFAERFGKKAATTASSLQTQATNPITPTAPTAPKKQVDPQKKMQAELIYLVKGIDAGRNAWYYVLVERLKVQMFLKALNDDIIHLENFGRILFSAYGDEPPASITEQLKDEYGIED